MATLAKRKRTKASIMMFSILTMRGFAESAYQWYWESLTPRIIDTENHYLRESMHWSLWIRHILYLCSADTSKFSSGLCRSEVKWTEYVYVKERQNRSEANWFILKRNNIEAKRTGSIVILYFKSREKANFHFFQNERQKTKVKKIFENGIF